MLRRSRTWGRLLSAVGQQLLVLRPPAGPTRAGTHPEPLLFAVLPPPPPGRAVQLQQPLQGRLLLRCTHSHGSLPAGGPEPRTFRGLGGLSCSLPPLPMGIQEPRRVARPWPPRLAHLLDRGAGVSPRVLQPVLIAHHSRVPRESCRALLLLRVSGDLSR
uniref:Uncharacterized protein n=1 Tax=Rousettus aegyptiacus TaxID=9407 RepID=A0A7J8D6W8_ROUAE|nr:hypothetical protein HJG63_008888 [Rousettus aegyptiacus]